VRRWQTALVVFGIAFLGLGGVVLLMEVNPARYVGILTWFVGALILHDGVAALAVFGVSIAMRRTGTRLPVAIIAMLQGALVIAAIVTAIVVPEILKSGLGTANPTILPLDYGPHLVLFYAGLTAVTAVAIAGYWAVARRQKLRPASSQD